MFVENLHRAEREQSYMTNPDLILKLVEMLLSLSANNFSTNSRISSACVILFTLLSVFKQKLPLDKKGSTYYTTKFNDVIK